MKKLLLLLAVFLEAGAETRLDQLLHWQRQTYTAAVITSGYYEARGLSRYRSQPGLHAGYDIALPAGSGARAAWPGQVRSLIPWAEGEWGVEVLHGDGSTATYGHIVPIVTVGQSVEVGQVVGLVARDHLDVKMRDPQGLLFDYGVGASAPQIPTFSPPRPDPQTEAFQALLRKMPEQEKQDAKRWQALQQAGLRVGGPPPASAWVELTRLRKATTPKKLALLRWTAQDRQRAEACKRRAEELKTRYDLGLVARNQWQDAQRRADLWRDVLAAGQGR